MLQRFRQNAAKSCGGAGRAAARIAENVDRHRVRRRFVADAEQLGDGRSTLSACGDRQHREQQRRCASVHASTSFSVRAVRLRGPLFRGVAVAGAMCSSIDATVCTLSASNCVISSMHRRRSFIEPFSDSSLLISFSFRLAIAQLGIEMSRAIQNGSKRTAAARGRFLVRRPLPMPAGVNSAYSLAGFSTFSTKAPPLIGSRRAFFATRFNRTDGRK